VAWTSLCQIDELIEGQGKYVGIAGFQLAVFLDDGRVYVLDNICPHAGGDLAEGSIEQGCVVCPWHSWTFHLENGQLRGAPGVTVRTYSTRLFPRENQPTLVQADLPIY
jgi:nitrite reductase (NADH) small subunit/3-phenylpropionate/trans-cinnamate dioxygenase ferredoxin subunit